MSPPQFRGLNQPRKILILFSLYQSMYSCTRLISASSCMTKLSIDASNSDRRPFCWWRPLLPIVFSSTFPFSVKRTLICPQNVYWIDPSVTRLETFQQRELMLKVPLFFSPTSDSYRLEWQPPHCGGAVCRALLSLVLHLLGQQPTRIPVCCL